MLKLCYWLVFSIIVYNILAANNDWLFFCYFSHPNYTLRMSAVHLNQVTVEVAVLVFEFDIFLTVFNPMPSTPLIYFYSFHFAIFFLFFFINIMLNNVDWQSLLRFVFSGKSLSTLTI